MTAAAAESLGIRRVGLARRIVVFVAVFAFALQSYIAQVHIHGASQGTGQLAAAQSHEPGKTPVHDGQTDCPFCQAIIHAGVFVAPAAPLLNLPFALIETVVPVVVPRAASNTVAHDWQSRAPPRF